MADVFLSYSQRDRSRVQKIVDALAKQGFEVWWDTSMLSGARFRTEIAKQLSQAKAVVVAWSNISINSEWVIDEAEFGKKRNVLLPILIDTCDPPLGLRQLHTERLVGWEGDASAPAWANLVKSIKTLQALWVQPATSDEQPSFEDIYHHRGRSRWPLILCGVGVLALLSGGAAAGTMAFPEQSPLTPMLVDFGVMAEPIPAKDKAILTTSSEYSTAFRTLANYVQRFGLERILSELGVQRLVDIIGDGHESVDDSVVLKVVDAVEAAEPSNLDVFGATLSAIEYRIYRPGQGNRQPFLEKRTQFVEALKRYYGEPSVCPNTCDKDWLLVTPTLPTDPASVVVPSNSAGAAVVADPTKGAVPGAGTAAGPASPSVPTQPYCIRRKEISVEEYRPFNPTYLRSANDREPVRNVSWYEALTFSAWMGARLPTEIEWRHAAEAAGSASSPDNGWFESNSGGTAHSVGEKANDGLADMYGNVAEWAADWFSDKPAQSDSDPRGSASRNVGTKLVLGGSYLANSDDSPDNRNSEHPATARSYVGVRLVHDTGADGGCVFEP